MEEKRCCSICKQWQLLSDFYKDRSRKNGLRSECKQCSNKKIAKYNLEYRANNGKERRRLYGKEWRRAHFDEQREKRRERILNNPERYRLIRKRACTKRLSTAKGRLSNIMSRRVYDSLRGKKNGRWEDLVDYTVGDLIKRLQATLPPGYTWDDYINGSDLQVDHIIPIAAFKFESSQDEDFKKCWALNNLQFLPAHENLTKGSKLHAAPSVVIAKSITPLGCAYFFMVM